MSPTDATCSPAALHSRSRPRCSRRPRVWWWTTLGNFGAMTLYLWHIPALLGIHLLFDEVGLPRYPGQAHFAAISIAQLLPDLASRKPWRCLG